MDDANEVGDLGLPRGGGWRPLLLRRRLLCLLRRLLGLLVLLL